MRHLRRLGYSRRQHPPKELDRVGRGQEILESAEAVFRRSLECLKLDRRSKEMARCQPLSCAYGASATLDIVGEMRWTYGFVAAIRYTLPDLEGCQ